MDRACSFAAWAPAARRIIRRLAAEFNLKDLRAAINKVREELNADGTPKPPDGSLRRLHLYGRLETEDYKGARPYVHDLRNDASGFRLLLRLRGGMYPTANMMHRQGVEGGFHCRLCPAIREDLEHVLLRCPALQAQREGLRAAVTAAVTECPRLAALLASPDADETLLGLSLGGDLARLTVPGLRAKPEPLVAGGSPAQPALARVRAQRAALPHVRAILAARLAELGRRGQIPALWSNSRFQEYARLP